MEAIEFLKEYQRICRCYHSIKCSGCPLKVCGCDIEHDDAQEIVKIVEEWSQAHPKKTMMQDFFEKFPNAPKGKFGQPQLCPGNCGYNNEIASYEVCKKFCSDCLKCWNRPVED